MVAMFKREIMYSCFTKISFQVGSGVEFNTSTNVVLQCREIGNWKGKCSESDGVSSKMWSPLLLGSTQAFSKLFLSFLLLKMCTFHGRKMDGDTVNSNGKTITESLITGALLLALLWELFRILKFVFHSSWLDTRPVMLAGGFPVMNWKLWLLANI